MIDVSDYRKYEALFRHFEAFSAIPHGSGNTSAIADFFVEFARARGLEYYRDGANNVVIRKPATKGYEDRPAVIFQGHLDMVAEKKTGAQIDMEREGLSLYRDGYFLRARDTTLGGDDGVALAYAMAVLDGEVEAHPDFEAVFTSDEEIGLLGAVALSPDAVKGRLLINIDSDEEGVFTVGCAGGVRSDISLPLEYEEADKSKKAYRVRLYGFKGGHSGVEIDKGRANAVKVLGELFNMSATENWRIASMSGGNADNAIPRECSAMVIAGEDFPEKFRAVLQRRMTMFAVMPDLPHTELRKMDKTGRTLRDIEPSCDIEIEEVALPARMLTAESQDNLICLLIQLPSGVIAMSRALPDLVETSLNLGILRVGERAEVSFSVRSAVGAEKKKLCTRLSEIAAGFGADYGERGEYPAWEYNEESHLRDVMVEVYERMYDKKPTVVTIHAGLECGIFAEKLPGIDCVSIGPDNFDIHTTEERLSIPSFVRVWEYLKEVLRNI